MSTQNYSSLEMVKYHELYSVLSLYVEPLVLDSDPRSGKCEERNGRVPFPSQDTKKE